MWERTAENRRDNNVSHATDAVETEQPPTTFATKGQLPEVATATGNAPLSASERGYGDFLDQLAQHRLTSTTTTQLAVLNARLQKEPALRPAVAKALALRIGNLDAKKVDAPLDLTVDLDRATQAIDAVGEQKLAMPSAVKLVQIAIVTDDKSAFSFIKSGGMQNQRDAKGGSMLDTLLALATGELGKDIDRSALLGDVIADVMNPMTMAQGEKGTCAATSMSYLLAQKQPAEYARLVADLADKDGTATLANGDTIARDRDMLESIDASRTLVYNQRPIDPAHAEGRRTSGLLLHPALMEYADATNDYHNREDEHFDAYGRPIGGGLLEDQIHRLQEGMFDKSARMIRKTSSDDRTDPITQERGAEQTLWSRSTDRNGMFTFRGQLYTPEQYLRSPFAKRAVLAMDWGATSSGGHAVVFEALGGDGRGYFYNPWGPTSKADQEAQAGRWPELKFEDTETGLCSLPYAVLLERVYAIIL